MTQLLAIDEATHTVFWRGMEIPRLTRREMQLVHYLSHRPGFVRTRSQILDAFWNDTPVEDQAIDQHIKRIRGKFRSVDPNFDAIQTLYAIGYRWKPDGG